MPTRQLFLFMSQGAALALFALWGVAGSTAADQDVRRLKGHSLAVTAVAFSPDGGLIASGSADKTIKLWDVQSGQVHKTISASTSAITAIAFSPDGKTVAAGANEADILLCDVATGELRAKLPGHTGKIRCLAFSPNGQWLASGSGDKTIRLWNARTGKFRTSLEGHARGVLCLSFGPRATTLASGSADESVKIWNVLRQCEETPDRIRTRGKRGPVVSVAFAADGRDLALVTPDRVEVWNYGEGQRRYVLMRRQEGSVWWSVRYSPQGTLLAMGSGTAYTHAVRLSAKKGLSTGVNQADENEIRLWDADAGHQIGRLIGHRDSVRSIDISPDGTLLASGSRDKTIMLWPAAKYVKSPGEQPVSQVSLINEDAMQLRTDANGDAFSMFAQGLRPDPDTAANSQVDESDGDDSSADEMAALLCDGGSLIQLFSDFGSTAGKGKRSKSAGRGSTGRGVEGGVEGAVGMGGTQKTQGAVSHSVGVESHPSKSFWPLIRTAARAEFGEWRPTAADADEDRGGNSSPGRGTYGSGDGASGSRGAEYRAPHEFGRPEHGEHEHGRSSEAGSREKEKEDDHSRK